MQVISRKEAISLGLKHYFTNKLCIREHIENRLVSTKQCLACERERNAKRRLLNPELVIAKKEYSKQYNQVNRTHLNELKRIKYKINEEFRDSESLRGKSWYRTEKGKLSRVKSRNKYRALKINAIAQCFNKALTDEFHITCPKGYEVDHIIPLSKGGNQDISNLQYLTKSQNISKRNKHYTAINLPTFCVPCSPIL